MSRYDWERGEIKMSTKVFGGFRRDMIAFHNSIQTRFFTKAQTVYTALKAAGKGKRNFDFQHAFDLAMAGASDLGNTDPGYYNQMMSRHEAYEVSGYEEIKDVLFPYEQVEGKGHVQSKRPKAPKKSSFKMLKQNADDVPVGHEAGIHFDKKRRVVIWSVGENNHAVERAHDHETGKEFFNRLSKIEWTRGTGGEIVGNDEYNRDSESAGGGANYVTHSYRMLTKKEKEAKARQYRDSLPSYNPYRGWNSRRGF